MVRRERIYADDQDLMGEWRNQAILQGAENLDSPAYGRNRIIKQFGREMARQLSWPNLRIDMERVGPLVDVDLLKHPFDGAIAFVFDRERLISFHPAKVGHVAMPRFQCDVWLSDLQEGSLVCGGRLCGGSPSKGIPPQLPLAVVL